MSDELNKSADRLIELANRQAARIEALEAALRFLLDRLDELDPSDVDMANDFNGHVAPAISRARAALDQDAGQ